MEWSIDIESGVAVCGDDDTLRNPSTPGSESRYKDQLKTPRGEDCPTGYPRLAAFLESDENFMVYRRFGYAGSRLLLRKQTELQRLEAAMIEMDEEDERASPGCLQSVDLEGDPSSPRARIMKDLETKYEEWGIIP
ncbi:MAG: hypothetical protein M1820_002307 [Bogoriella megaspora]|nr:MAG: hypothetical protein M1820_002307 [Bogoriella megaspora]